MAEPKTHRFAGTLTATENQALMRLCAAKEPTGKPCVSAVFRDLLAEAYWTLLKKYNGLDSEPEPLPELESEGGA